MPDHPDIIRHYSKVISNRYAFYAWIMGFFAALFFALDIFHLIDAYYISILTDAIWMVLVLFLAIVLRHRHRMLSFLKMQNGNQFSVLEEYLTQIKEYWERTIWVRIIIGISLGMAMLLLLFFSKDSNWAQRVFAWFVVFILAIMLAGWIQFRDQILLHDIRRSIRDQTSDTSE